MPEQGGHDKILAGGLFDVWWGPLHVGRWGLAMNKGDSRFGMSTYLSGSSMFKERGIGRYQTRSRKQIYLQPEKRWWQDGSLVHWYTSMPGALACTVTHVALVPIDVVPWRKLTGCLNLFGKGGFSWFNKLFWEEIWRNRLNMMTINENLFQSGLQNW